MNGNLDLELYTIAMTRLNNGFAKVGNLIQDNASTLNAENNDENKKEKLDKMAVTVKRALPDFKTSLKEFKDLKEDINSDLNQSEINLDDYEPFFKHVQETFPKSCKDLEASINGIQKALQTTTESLSQIISDLLETINNILEIFNDIYSISSNSLEKIQTGEMR